MSEIADKIRAEIELSIARREILDPYDYEIEAAYGRGLRAALALIDKEPPAPVVTHEMVERFETAMYRWTESMRELTDGPIYTPSAEQARPILVATLTEPRT